MSSTLDLHFCISLTNSVLSIDDLLLRRFKVALLDVATRLDHTTVDKRILRFFGLFTVTIRTSNERTNQHVPRSKLKQSLSRPSSKRTVHLLSVYVPMSHLDRTFLHRFDRCSCHLRRLETHPQKMCRKP